MLIMNCINPNTPEIKMMTEKGKDPFSAIVELASIYKEFESLEKKGDFKTIANKAVDLKDVSRFMNSERYTSELKEALSENINNFGEIDSVYDYLKHGYIRKPNLFLQEPVSDLEDFMSSFRTVEEIIQHSNQENALSFAKDISQRMNVPIKIILESEFLEMFPGRNPSVNRAFFKNGEVYFVEGYLNKDTVFHEFSHPFVKAIRIDNVELFNNLWNDFLQDVRSTEILERLDSENELERSSFEYKQEAMVRLLEKEFVEPKKTNFITQLLYNIKQFLRKLIGAKINISKLSVNTKLEDVVKMISEGGEILFNQNFVNQDDVVEFQTKYNEFTDSLKQQSKKLTQELMDDYYKFVEKQVINLKSNLDIQGFLAEDLVNEDSQGILEQMKKTLSNLSYIVGNKPVIPLEQMSMSIQSEATDLEYKIQAFAKVISDVNILLNVFEKKIDTLFRSSDKSSDNFFDSILSINNYLDLWENKYKEYIELLPSDFKKSDGTIITNPILKKIKEDYKTILDLRTKSKTLQEDSIFNVLYEAYNEFNAPIIKDLKEKLDYFEKNDMYDAYIRTHVELYGMSPVERLELNNLNAMSDLLPDEIRRRDKLETLNEDGYALTKDSFLRTMSGQTKDSSYLSGMFENYANNQDAVVSTFAMSLKNTFNELSGNVNSKMNTFLTELEPLLKDAGLDIKLFGEGTVGMALRQDNITFIKDADGNIKEHEEFRFLNNFKNWEYPLAVLQKDVKSKSEIYSATNKDEDLDAYWDALEKLEDFQEDYMHREYLQEYYDVQKIFRGDIGRKSKKRYTDVLKRINFINSKLSKNNNDKALNKSLIELNNEYRDLYNLYDSKGIKKTGDELLIAETIKSYLEANKNFTEQVENSNQFENTFEAFIKDLKRDFPDPSNPEYIAKVKDWLHLNTTTSLSDAYYENRQRLVDRRKELLAFVTAQNKSFYDTTPLYDELNELLKVNKDEFGVIDGSQMSFDKQKRIVELQEEIKKIEKDYYEPKTGLTQGDVKKYKILKHISYSGIRRLTPDEIQFMDDYEEAIHNKSGIYKTGLTKDMLRELDLINSQLRKISRPVTTDAYVKEFTLKIESSKQYDLFKTFALEKGYNLDDTDVVTVDLIDDFLDDYFSVNDILSLDDDFEKWFSANHVLEENYISYGQGGLIDDVKDVYRKSSAWKTSRPLDNSGFKIKSVSSLNGLPAEFIEGDKLVIDGVPVIPNKQYQKNRVKEEYKTEKIERDKVEIINDQEVLVLANIDNRGNWLPRDFVDGSSNSAKDRRFIDEKYKLLFKEDNASFKLLDFLKNKQLDHEKDLNDGSKIYLSFPGIRKGKIEGLDKNWFNRKKLRFKEFFRGAADDAELETYSGKDRTGIGKSNELNPFYRPISGNFKIDKIDVSTNIISSLLQRMGSIEDYKIAKKKSAFTQAALNTITSFMENPNKKTFQESLRECRKYSSEEIADNQRYKQLERIVKKNIHGVNLFANTSDVTARVLTGVAGQLQKGVARASFSFDIIKAMRNMFGGMSMMWKKALDSNGFGLYDLIITQGKPTKLVAEMVKQRYSKSALPVDMQLVFLLDGIPDAVRTNLSTYGSQTVSQDVIEGNFRYTVRKYMNDSVPIHQIYALLHANKVMYNGKEYPLYELVELNKGVIQTKAGVPTEWKISYDTNGKIILGSKIKDVMNEHKSLLNKNLGLAGKSEENDGNKTIIGKILGTMMKFFPGMLMDRYGIKFSQRKGLAMRRNLNQKRLEIGTFTSIILLAQEAMDRKGKFYMLRSYSPQALRGFYQLLSSFLIQYLLFLAIRGVGFDEDDDEIEDFKFDPEAEGIFGRIRNTTALPQLPFVSDNRTVVNTGNSFDAENYAKLQMLNLLVSVEQEEATFNPLNALVTSSGLTFGKSVLAEAGTVDAVRDIINIWTGPERKLVYDKDAGPYVWQEEDVNKSFNVMIKMLGLNAGVLDPAKSIENKYNMLSR